MSFLWKVVSDLGALAGVICWYCAVSTSDFWVLEMGQTPPDDLNKWLILGAVLVAPKMLEIVIGAIVRSVSE